MYNLMQDALHDKPQCIDESCDDLYFCLSGPEIYTTRPQTIIPIPLG